LLHSAWPNRPYTTWDPKGGAGTPGALLSAVCCCATGAQRTPWWEGSTQAAPPRPLVSGLLVRSCRRATGVQQPQRDLAPQEGAPILHTFCSFVLKFSKYKIIWPVMALACGSLHTVVTFVPNG
jgi:hypothetical protein